jgi:hypothetical protein
MNTINFLKPHLNQRFAQKVIGLQSGGSFNFENFGTFELGVSRKMTFGATPMASHKECYIGGRWWLPPTSGHGESCESVYARGLSVHQKCFNYVLTNLLFSLCKSIWIIDPLVTHLSLNPKLLACPFYPQNAASLGTYPNPFHFQIHIWIFQGVWGCINICLLYDNLYNFNLYNNQWFCTDFWLCNSNMYLHLYSSSLLLH